MKMYKVVTVKVEFAVRPDFEPNGIYFLDIGVAMPS